MSEDLLIELTRNLLAAIRGGDWESYRQLCGSDLTCFEPETEGHLVRGLDFHKFYFDLGGHMGAHADTLVDPSVLMLGEDGAVVAYTRLVQVQEEGGISATRAFQETRVWLRTSKGWKHVHFHRSAQSM